MKWLVSILILLLLSGSVYAEKTFFYKTYKEKTGEVINETSFHIGALTDGKIIVQWQSKTNGDTVEQVLNSDYAIRTWKAISPKEKTDYVGDRTGNQLLIKGKHKGKEINKTAEIDDQPFFFHPALGLSEFVRSGKKSLEFWTVRPDILKE